MKSIIQKNKCCYVCGIQYDLHLHHIIYGKNRSNSDKDGLVVYLCKEHHEGTNGVHGKNGHNLDESLKKLAEECWIKYNNSTIEKFIERYKKNYL